MLVQMTFNEAMREAERSDGQRFMGEVFCAMCSSSVGVVDEGEFRHLMYSYKGDVLCFDCESRQPRVMKKIPVAIRRRLVEMYDVLSVDDLPLSTAPAWANERGVIAQLEPMVGWLLWYPDHYGVTALRRIKVPHDVIAGLREDWHLSPFMLV